MSIYHLNEEMYIDFVAFDVSTRFVLAEQKYKNIVLTATFWLVMYNKNMWIKICAENMH